jgi:hypothetical protein
MIHDDEGVAMTYEYKEPTGAYTVTIPGSYEYSRAKSTVAIFRAHDGVGAINLSTFVTTVSAPSSASSLLAEALHGREPARKPTSAKAADGTDVAHSEYESGDFWWRVWMLARGRRVVYVTYNCRLGSKGQEDEAVDAILASIRLKGEQSDSVSGG